MKTSTNKIVFFFALLMAFSFAASAQVVILRPGAPVVKVRPVAPSPRYIWIDGEWNWRGGRYVWTDGYWMMPRQGMVWIGGQLETSPWWLDVGAGTLETSLLVNG
jgi:hypothetical protein